MVVRGMPQLPIQICTSTKVLKPICDRKEFGLPGILSAKQSEPHTQEPSDKHKKGPDATASGPFKPQGMQ